LASVRVCRFSRSLGLDDAQGFGLQEVRQSSLRAAPAEFLRVLAVPIAIAKCFRAAERARRHRVWGALAAIAQVSATALIAGQVSFSWQEQRRCLLTV
jgi:hypothetical protein